jgi:predicted DNA-binding protein YlxM (UPF0122 family)
MTRLEIENSLKELNSLVLEGKMLDAFEKYYHEDVSMQEMKIPLPLQKQLTVNVNWNSWTISPNSAEQK